MRTEVIGLSHQGRLLVVRYLGSELAPVRLLFVCGQHGDERAVRHYVRSFVEERAAELESTLPLLQLAVLEDANPDGFAARTRTNAQGIDLNRDHVRLEAPETRALHDFIRRWSPHLVVDFHNYPARRKHLVEQKLRLGWDVCLDIPTNPAAGCRADVAPLSWLFEQLGRVAQQEGFHFGRYGLYEPDGTFRHGTPQLGDARNTITLRHEVPTLLVEVRNPSRASLPEDRPLLRAAVAASAWEICSWAMREIGYLATFSRPADFGPPVPLGFRRQAAGGTQVPVRELESGALRTLSPAKDRCQIQGRRHRKLPPSYRVAEAKLLDLLVRQGYQLHPPRVGSRHWKVPVRQRGGRMLALLLDEQSRYQAAREK